MSEKYSIKNLRNYQKGLVRTLTEDPNKILNVDMGLGKTAISLYAIRHFLRSWIIRKVLIIAPLAVASYSWPDEIEAWEELSYLPYALLLGNKKQREDAFASNARIHIINRENTIWLWKHIEEKGNPGYDWVIYDELERAKKGSTVKAYTDPKTGKKRYRVREYGALMKICEGAKYRTGLLGNLYALGILNFWGPMNFISPGLLGNSQNQYQKRYFTPDKTGNVNGKKNVVFSWKLRYGSEKEILGLMKDKVVTLRLKDAGVDLPRMLPPIDRKIKLPPATLKRYRKFIREKYDELTDIEAVNAAVVYGKARQFVNGAMYRTDEDEGVIKEVHKVHNLKLKELENIAENLKGRPLLVAYAFESDRDIITSHFKGAITTETPDWKKKWDNREAPMLVAHPLSVGHGLNLQKGGSDIVWYGLTYLSLYQQFNRRLERSGQTERVRVFRLIVEDTIEEDILEKLKIAEQEEKYLEEESRE